MSRSSARLPPLNALRAFEAAARHLSFKKAARELHVTAGAVSHQVKLLEDHLGVALFRRLTRALELTAEAQAMLPKVREGLDSLAAAVERVRAREELCALTVMAPPNFSARWLVPRLSRFTNAHPNLELHIASRPAMIDGRGNGGSVAPVEGRDDAPLLMVRFGAGHYPGMVVDQVFSARYVPVCSPRLLKGKHAIRTPADLPQHTLLHDDTVIEEGARPTWGDWFEKAGVDGVDANRGTHFSDASLALEAAIEGMGVALAMRPLVSAEVDAGRLVVPFDIAAETKYSFYLVSPEAALNNRSVAAFREWLLAESAPDRTSS
ncbi:MAG TPA: transcriptional regulator GcvA [Usitatibacter sp.]|nr:transcriptional regulator GcvA [Usitatibacter sp.]